MRPPFSFAKKRYLMQPSPRPKDKSKFATERTTTTPSESRTSLGTSTTKSGTTTAPTAPRSAQSTRITENTKPAPCATTTPRARFYNMAWLYSPSLSRVRWRECTTNSKMTAERGYCAISPKLTLTSLRAPSPCPASVSRPLISKGPCTQADHRYQAPPPSTLPMAPAQVL